QGVSDPFEVETDLVLPSGMQTQFYQCGILQPFAHLVIRCRVESRLVLADELAPAVTIAGRDARADRALRWIGNALHEREIVAPEAMRLEELASCGVRVLRERDGERSRSVAIEAMQHADVGLVSELELHVLAHAAEHGV